MGSAMGNPWEYREILAVSFAYDKTRTVEQVVAAHKRASEDSASERKMKGNVRQISPDEPAAAPPLQAHVPDSKITELQDLFSQAAALRGESSNIPDL